MDQVIQLEFVEFAGIESSESLADVIEKAPQLGLVVLSNPPLRGLTFGLVVLGVGCLHSAGHDAYVTAPIVLQS